MGIARPVVLIALLAVLTPWSPLRAQDIPSPYRYIERGQAAELFVGYMDAATGRLGYGPEGGLLFGGRYALELTGPLALEGAVALLPTTRDVVHPRRPEEDRVIDEAEANLVFLDVRLRFALTGRRTWNGIQPFVLAGGGVSFDAAGTQAEDEPLETAERFEFGTKLSGVFGAGARIFISERIALRTDASLTLYRLDAPEGWLDADLELDPPAADEWVSSPTFSVGLSYLF